jgi:AraC-like DNA-binding protein
MDPSAALALARITPAQLHQPHARITAEQMETFCGHAMRELDDEALGWFSRPLPWGSFGMLARASITSPTLELALKRWCRHHRLLTEDIELDLSIQGSVATVAIEERRPLGDMREFCLVTTLRNLHGYACWTIDSRIPIRQATFPFPAPAHHEVYGLMFRGPIVFEAGRASVAFDAPYLSLALRRDERALQAMLRRALPLIVLQYRRDRLLVSQIESLLLERASQASSADTVAQALHVSVRTLHRQLRDEGASLQSLKNSARRQQAIDELCRGTRPIKQIAAATGFSSEKSFARAFRQWTGQAPSVFRAQARNT